jgi:hypothetical protein
LPVAGFTTGEMKCDGHAAEICLQVTLCSTIPRVSDREPDRFAPFCVGRRDRSSYYGGVEHLNEMRRLGHRREHIKEGSNVPVRLSRQSRFHTLFQCPNWAGSARLAML